MQCHAKVRDQDDSADQAGWHNVEDVQNRGATAKKDATAALVVERRQTSGSLSADGMPHQRGCVHFPDEVSPEKHLNMPFHACSSDIELS